MEHMLLKLARQLDAIDEASLMSMWDKYAAIVSKFEPTKRWEESVLVFSLIQSKRWKNQLFNQQWAEQSRPAPMDNSIAPPELFNLQGPAAAAPPAPKKPAKSGKILNFRSEK